MLLSDQSYRFPGSWESQLDLRNHGFWEITAGCISHGSHRKQSFKVVQPHWVSQDGIVSRLISSASGQISGFTEQMRETRTFFGCGWGARSRRHGCAVPAEVTPIQAGLFVCFNCFFFFLTSLQDGLNVPQRTWVMGGEAGPKTALSEEWDPSWSLLLKNTT